MKNDQSDVDPVHAINVHLQILKTWGPTEEGHMGPVENPKLLLTCSSPALLLLCGGGRSKCIS